MCNLDRWSDPNEALKEDTDGYMVIGYPALEPKKKLQFYEKYIIYNAHTYNRYYLSFDSSFEAYIDKFSSKSRSTLKRKVKKFSKHCAEGIEFRSYKDADELNIFYGLARKVSCKTYQENILDSGLPESVEFQQKMLSLARENKVRAYLLFDSNKPIAYLYLTAHEDTLLYNHLGYDPEYAKWSVGSVLHWLVLESLFAEGQFAFLDFTQGEGQQKKTFSTGSILCSNIFVLKRSFFNMLLLSSHILVNLTSKFLGDVFEKLGLKTKIRQIIRRGFHTNA